MSTARRSAPAQPRPWSADHAGRPLVVDVRSLPPLPLSALPVPALPVPPPVQVHDLGEVGVEGGYDGAHDNGYDGTYDNGYDGGYDSGYELAGAGWPGPAEPREPTFDELVHGYGRHRGSAAARGPRRASRRRA